MSDYRTIGGLIAALADHDADCDRLRIVGVESLPDRLDLVTEEVDW